MPVQTTVSQKLRVGSAGTVVDATPHSIDTRAVENAAVTNRKVLFGKAAIQGSTPGQTVTIPTATFTADLFEGVIMNNFLMEVNLNNSADYDIDEGAAVGVLNWGRAWAKLPSGATPQYGQPVYVIHGGANAGLFTNIASGNIAIEARFIGGIEADNIAPIEIFRRTTA